jgi:hypothetical protein
MRLTRGGLVRTGELRHAAFDGHRAALPIREQRGAGSARQVRPP